MMSSGGGHLPYAVLTDAALPVTSRPRFVHELKAKPEPAICLLYVSLSVDEGGNATVTAQDGEDQRDQITE